MATVVYLLAVALAGWIGTMLAAADVGGTAFVILIALGIVLKLAGVIAWSWWWALLPLWGALGGSIAKVWLVTHDPMWPERM